MSNKICKDYDADCSFVKDYKSCHFHEVGTGYCPYLVNDSGQIGRDINPDQVCPDCFRTMDIILTNFNGSGTVKNFVCPVCHPDKKEVKNV